MAAVHLGYVAADPLKSTEDCEPDCGEEE